MVDPSNYERDESQEEQEQTSGAAGDWEEPDEPLDVDSLITAAGDFAAIGLGPGETRELKDQFEGLAKNVTKIVDLEGATRGMTVKDKMPRKTRLGLGFGTLIAGPILARGFYNYQKNNKTVDVDAKETGSDEKESKERQKSGQGAGFETDEQDVEDL